MSKRDSSRKKPVPVKTFRVGACYEESRPLVPVLVALMLGITADKVFVASDAIELPLTPVMVFWMLFWLLSLSVSCWLTFRLPEGLNKYSPVPPVSFAVFLTTLFAMGGMYHHFYWNVYPANEISRTLGDGFSLAYLDAKIAQPPRASYPTDEMFYHQDEELMTTTLELRVRAMKIDEEWWPTSGKVTARIQGLVTDFHAGDRVYVLGRLRRPATAMNPGAFSADLHYRKERELCLLNVVSPANVTLVKRPKIWGVWRTLEFLRDCGQERIEKFLRPGEQGVASALFLGTRAEVPREELNRMLETGTLHLMSISGLHVGLLAGGFYLLLSFFQMPRVATAVFVISVVFLYVMVTGARPPAIRAGVIVSITVIASCLSRQKSNINSLAAAGILVLALNPTALFSTGTQLSFLAVGTLIYTPILKRSQFKQQDLDSVEAAALSWEYLFLKGAPRKKILKELVISFGIHVLNMVYTSFMMMVVMLPLVSNRFHVMALIGVFMNVLISIPMLVTMMCGAFVILFSWIPLLGWVFGNFFGWLCSLSLRLMSWMIQWGTEIPGHCFWTRGTPMFWNVLLYTILLFLCLFPRLRFAKRRYYAALFVVMMGILLGYEYSIRKQPGELRCTFISISHGLAVLVEFPNGQNMLFDAGQFAPSPYPVQTISGYLWNQGIHRIDALVISHPDMDHYNAVPGLLERFPVGEVFVSPVMMATMERKERESSNPELDDTSEKTAVQQYYAMRREREAPSRDHLVTFFQAVHRHGIPFHEIRAGDHLAISPECSIEVLHPTQHRMTEDPDMTNANSLVLDICYNNRHILLTGDLAPPGMMDVMELYPEAHTVVQSPHHGGKTCNTPQFARWCRAEHVIICESYNNEQKFASEVFRETGAKVHHTGREGAVTFRFHGDKMDVITKDNW